MHTNKMIKEQENLHIWDAACLNIDSREVVDERSRDKFLKWILEEESDESQRRDVLEMVVKVSVDGNICWFCDVTVLTGA